VVERVGGGFDAFISKNTLKRGYIHPRGEADEGKLVRLGVDDEAFLRAVFGALKPGGVMLVYNIAPAQDEAWEKAGSGKGYLPHADGEFPFSRALVSSVGFEVLAFDERDDGAVLDFWRVLGYDDGKPREEAGRNVRSWWTLLRKPTAE
jgi:hypothetical protein